METSDGHCNIALRKVPEKRGCGGGGVGVGADLPLIYISKLILELGCFCTVVVFLSLKGTKSVI